jgi:hypothetical protein
MPTLGQILSDDSKLVCQAIRLMAEDATTVESMTRTQLHLHMDIRERMLKAQHGDDWQTHYDAEFAEKRQRWMAARDFHEMKKRLRAAQRVA